MKKDIQIVDKEKGVVRVTTIDERWYAIPYSNKVTGLPDYKYYPSSTWIASYYYTSPYLIKYIAEKGLTEADAIKQAAGEKGSKVHQGTEILDKGEEIGVMTELLNTTTNQKEVISIEEYEALISYRDWFNLNKPEILATEMTVYSDKYEYAGTLDRIIALGMVKEGVRQIYILDFKTSKAIYKSHMIQLSSYKHADIDYKALGISDEEWENRKMLILQLGYKLNKNGYKATEVEDKFKLFLNSRETWMDENPDTKPKQRDLPLSIKLELKVVEEKEVKKPKK